MGAIVVQNIPSRYWKIWRIHPAAERSGYELFPVIALKEFADSQVFDTEDNNVQNALLSCFKSENYGEDNLNRARAGLCLRCYVSEPILRECKKLESLFSGEKQFTYRDLLPFVLDDDGEKLIILAQDGKTQLILNNDSQILASKYSLFSVKILQTFNPELESRMSLENWAYLKTKQNPDLKKFLSEFGFKHLSDWALLNKVRKRQIENLLAQERYLIQAFHAVYRRDRQQQKNRGNKKCSDPTTAQLKEMLIYLQQHKSWINTPVQLIEELRQIALQLRRYDVWNSRESLYTYDEKNNTNLLRRDLPNSSLDEADIEEQEFLKFFHQLLYTTLSQTIKQEVEANIQKLQTSKKYASFATKYIQGLYLYYESAMSLKEIVPELGMTSRYQARRILNPGELLSKVRTKTVEQMLKSILEKAAEKGLTKLPPEVNYLRTLTEKIESYVDVEIFQQASEEIRAGINRRMSSTYANELRYCIQEYLQRNR